MAEEFQESEVMFHLEVAQETEEGNDVDTKYARRAELGEIFKSDRATLKSEANEMKKTCKNTISSIPVNIPDDKKHWFNYVDMEVSGEDYCGGADFAPPHVIIGHRVAGTTIPFSVCTGNGRTLKGRDLSDVRNSILRMTGFLET